jgi:hypothetical protein
MSQDLVEAEAGPRVRRGRSTALVLALGAVSWAWSEVGFWSTFRAEDSAVGWIITWLAYSLVVGVVLRVARRFPVRGLSGLVILGALYGWLVEGVVAATVYEQLPFSLIWTGVAWHGMLTVVVGWWLLPKVLRRGGLRAWAVCASIGLAWGAWSVGWWGAAPDQREEPVVPGLASYAAFVAIVSAAAILGYLLVDRVPLRDGDLRSRWGAIVSVAVLAVWGGVMVLPSLPWAPLVLGPLLALAWFSLRRLSRDEPPSGRTAIAADWPVGVPLRRLGPLTLVPVTAVALYAALVTLDAGVRGEGPFFALLLGLVLLMTLVGSVALLWSLWHAWRPRRRRSPGELSKNPSASEQLPG